MYHSGKVIGKTIKEIRQKMGMSQGDIYKQTNILPSRISNLENGHIKHPRLDTIYKISKCFNMKISEFLSACENNGHFEE